MALFLNSPPSVQPIKPNPSITSSKRSNLGRRFQVKSCFSGEPLVKEALKEPVAFFGGVFAGLLRLDLNEDPLKEWIKRSVEASSGFNGDEADNSEGGATTPQGGDEESPQQIEIE